VWKIVFGVMNSKNVKFFALFVLVVLFTSCGKVSDISISSIGKVQLRGIKKNIVLLNLDVEVDNPNKRKITITKIEFKAWLKERELGVFRMSENIKLQPQTKQTYTVPVEIELRTLADAFRLATGGVDDLLDKIEVEGYIKGRSFPVRKKLSVQRQSFKELANTL